MPGAIAGGGGAPKPGTGWEGGAIAGGGGGGGMDGGTPCPIAGPKRGMKLFTRLLGRVWRSYRKTLPIAGTTRRLAGDAKQ